MLDIKFIKENVQAVKQAVQNKKVQPKVDVDELIKTHEEVRELEDEVIAARTMQNELTDKIKFAKDDEERKISIQEATSIKEEFKSKENSLKELQEKFMQMMLLVPNVTSPEMPVGKDDSGNVVVSKWGEIPEFDFEPKDHVELGEKLDLIEIDRAAEVSGSRFYYLKNEAVLMQFGIIQFVLKTLMDEKVLAEIAKEAGSPFNKVFQPVLPPVLMKPEIMKKMDRLDPQDERYLIKNDDLVLVGSAEHTLGPLLMDTTLNEEDLPIRYIGYSTAFRRESGSYGKDVRGILRVHQFDKLEMESFVPAEFGEVEQKFILGIQQYLVQKLGLPYQVLQICTGDTGKPDYNQFDIECWIPSQKKYRETHTSDYMTDFQARRLNIKYKVKQSDKAKQGDKVKNSEKKYAHMNDATAFAISRTLIAILENYQQADGSVKVPEVLVPYVGKDLINRG